VGNKNISINRSVSVGVILQSKALQAQWAFAHAEMETVVV
jgi:hypothetical protein